ncbi:hypothetical protein JOF48_000328 [Arthrobacter stackebrandtii]|uniref:Uncharacterized protein n=1 Tax=Arthrobacter stackebrandtii TaxID=272161 RepID=A0ABS4YRZ0_9MICC|nr:hypothetical protein [Arthrobacter stackebrandtii]
MKPLFHPPTQEIITPLLSHNRREINSLSRSKNRGNSTNYKNRALTMSGGLGPLTIYYEETIQESFPGGVVPSVATIARLLSSVGHVDAAPRKRPKSSYIPFARSSAMAMWQLDAFEYRLANAKSRHHLPGH